MLPLDTGLVLPIVKPTKGTELAVSGEVSAIVTLDSPVAISGVRDPNAFCK